MIEWYKSLEINKPIMSMSEKTLRMWFRCWRAKIRKPASTNVWYSWVTAVTATHCPHQKVVCCGSIRSREGSALKYLTCRELNFLMIKLSINLLGIYQPNPNQPYWMILFSFNLTNLAIIHYWPSIVISNFSDRKEFEDILDLKTFAESISVTMWVWESHPASCESLWWQLWWCC